MAGGYNKPDRVKDPAIHKLVKRDTPTALINYHFVQPMPRGVLPSRVRDWCQENCQYGWLIQYPRMGHPSFRNTVFIFEDAGDLDAFRAKYCYDEKYHKRPHESDWMESVLEVDR